MKTTPILAACMAALSLAGCGGGGDSNEFRGPEFTLSKEDLAVAAAEEHFAKLIAEAPEPVPAEAPPTCEPGSCPPLPADAFDVVGKDLVLEATDPSSTLPNGKAWLSMKSPPVGTPLTPLIEPKVPSIETMLSFNPAKPATPASAAEDGRASAQGVVFGTSAKIVDPKTGARPQRVKIFIYRKSAPLATRHTVCSGTLIDSQWVLTAAHCLYNEKDGGYANVVTISPGFENGKHPYGMANHVAGTLLVAKGWIDAPGGGTDVGWFKLTRPMGGLTGWHTYSPMPGGNFALQQEFVNSSYPADAAFPFPGLFPEPNGQRMWETRFTFDRQLGGGSHYEVDYPLGGGASGSGAVLHAGCSNLCYGGNVFAIFEKRGFKARYNALTHAHVAAIHNSIQQTSSLGGVDLAPASVRVVTATKDSQPASDSSPVTEFNKGEQAYLVAWIHNNSSTNFQGNLNVSLYLSENDTISTFDKPVNSFTINNVSIKAKESRVITPPFNIPCARTDGQPEPETRYLGIIINNSDAVNHNNDSSGQFAPAAIKIKGTCLLALPVGHGTLNP
jgi:Trypsin